MNINLENILSFALKTLRNKFKIFAILFLILSISAAALLFLIEKPLYTHQFSVNSSFLSTSNILSEIENLQNLIDNKKYEPLIGYLEVSEDEAKSIIGIQGKPHEKNDNYSHVKIIIYGTNKLVLQSFFEKFKNSLLSTDYVKALDKISKEQTVFIIDQLKSQIEMTQSKELNSTIYVSNNNIVEMINSLNIAEKKLDNHSVLYLVDTPITFKSSNSLIVIILSVILFSFLAVLFIIVGGAFLRQSYKKLLS